jgi:serine/threonine-protein kinase RsbW
VNHNRPPIPLDDSSTTIWRVDRRISSDPREGVTLIHELVAQLRRERWDESDAFGIHLALEEAIANAICHGNSHSLEKSIRIQFAMTADSFYAKVTDEGSGFDPQAIPDPTDDANLERPCGRGLKLMRCYMDHVVYCSQGNSVELFKRRTGLTPGEEASAGTD